MAILEFRGVHRKFLHDSISEINLEGALSCGKTTVALWKELEALKHHPGIWIYLGRWTDTATKTLLKPAFEQLARIHGTVLVWNRDEHYYQLENGSRAFAFGLQTQSTDPEQRYGKIRGLAVSRIFIDQAEQLPEDIASELRARLRPDIEARLRGQRYPTQLTFTPNPVSPDHWLAVQFPTDNHINGRHYYSVSLFDNQHNLPTETIDGLLRMYPPTHPKHQTVILGKRGLTVIGESIYGGVADDNRVPAFSRALHERAITVDPLLPLLEAFDAEKHHPCVVWAQITPYSQFQVLGGLFGQNLYLEEFAPIVLRYRADWFHDHLGAVHTCCGPSGAHVESADIRDDSALILRDQGFAPIWKDNSNSPDVRLAMIERIAGTMRRRTPRGEAFSVEVHPDRWLRVSADGNVIPWKFMADALEAGYVWDDHYVSVASKEIRRSKRDDWYEHGMTALELLCYHFGGAQPSPDQMDRHAARVQRRALVEAQRDLGERFRWSPVSHHPRGGY